MRILQINNQHFLKGGAHKVYFDTSHLLQSKNHEVHFFSLSDKRNLECDDSKFFPHSYDYRNQTILQKILNSKNFVKNADAYQKLLQLVEQTKPNIAHIHLFMGGLTSTILLALKEKKVPIVHTVHDYRLICPAYLMLDGSNKICERCKGNKYYNCIIHKCSEKDIFQSLVLSADSYYRKFFIKPIDLIDRFIFVSKFAQRKHLEFDPRYNQKSTTLFNFIKDFPEEKVSYTKGDYFLFIGRLSREKGIHTLVKVIELMNVKLKIAGNGPLYKNIINYHNIELLGFKKTDEIIELIKHCSFLVIPSEWYENNPMSVIEAFSLGKPVIGANIGGIPELIKDGENGFLFEPGNEKSLLNIIKKAINISDDLYFRMSNNARNFAEDNFNPGNHYKSLMYIYEDVINNYKEEF